MDVVHIDLKRTFKTLFGSAGGFIFKLFSSVEETPTTGENFLYFKSDGLLYKKNSSGVETLIEAREGSTDARIISRVAKESVGGNRVVIAEDDGEVSYASCLEPTHLNRVLGITVTAIQAGQQGDIQVEGIMTEVSWNWTMGTAIFLSTNGLLTQTAPSNGFSLVLGEPLSPTEMLIRIEQPILLA